MRGDVVRLFRLAAFRWRDELRESPIETKRGETVRDSCNSSLQLRRALVGRVALRHDDASPREAPYHFAHFQTVEKLAEIEAVELDGVALSHNSTELPGQVRGQWQARS